MSEQTLKFDHIVVNKKNFHASKQAIVLDLVESSRILVLTNLNTIKMVLNILLVIYMMMMLSELCVLFYPQGVDI